MASCCPACKRPLPKPRKSEPVVFGLDTSTMSEGEVRAYYARTAPVEDVRFFLNHAAITPELEAEAVALLTKLLNQNGVATPADKVAYKLLHQHWRAASNNPAVTYRDRIAATYTAA